MSVERGLPRITAITGGIGVGKSMVSRILRAMGYEVYDCDSRAKILMAQSPEIIARIESEISGSCVIDGAIDRKCLASIVFSNPQKLEILNDIVHEAVRSDLAGYVRESGANRVFVETAILYQSGLDRMVDEVWEVAAPVHMRIERVMARSGLTADEVTSRINSQEAFIPECRHPNVESLVNDGLVPLLPQIEALLGN